MELGEKLRQARIDAGLTQRQLCGEEITRNMLSLIESGKARPSMKTLQYLAARLGKPVSCFLEETAVMSPNQQCIFLTRQRYAEGDFSGAARALEDYQEPDPIFDPEHQLLHILIHLELAEQALAQNRQRYAQELLEKSSRQSLYCGQALERQRLLLMGRLKAQTVSPLLPSLDGELLLRAEEALAAGNPQRAGKLLDAAENQTTPQWQLLRGNAWLAHGNYRLAADHFLAAEPVFPKETAPKLEQCYRELGDFKRAYEYACKQR